MLANVRNNKRHSKPVRFTESPLDVYDTLEWNPLDDYHEDRSYNEPLDLDFIEMLAKKTVAVAKAYRVESVPRHPNKRIEGEEVGDDRVDFTLDPLVACSALVAQEEVMGMVTSEADTNLSNEIWNFCEITSFVPLHPDQSFDRCRKVSDFRDLGFVDVPPLRILLDVAKGDRSHSSTAVGKASMLGSRMRTPRAEFLSDFHLASFLQDGYLRTSRSDEPKYLPQIMGGSGCRAPFGEPVNLLLSVYAYKDGRCQRIYGSATRELRQSLDSLERGEVIMPILCRRLRDRQEYLHGTYAEKIFIPTRAYQSTFGEKLPDPLITASGGNNLFSAFENRLLRTRHLVTRTGAEREWEFTTRIRASLLQRYKTVVTSNDELAFRKMRARAEFGGALSANTALAHLLERKGSLQDVIQLTNENFHVVNCGATHFTKWDAEWLFFGGKSDNFSIEDLTSSEDLFVRTEVSEDESLRVGSIPLRPIIGNPKIVRTTTTVGLYQIGSGMYEWAEDLSSRLIQRRLRVQRPLNRNDALLEYQVDPEWVNDDTLIIARCLQDTVGRAKSSTTVGLVSADKRLGNQLANSCNVAVIRVDPRPYIVMCRELQRSPLVEPDPSDLAKLLPEFPEKRHLRCVYIDSGSVNAYLARVCSDETTGELKVKVPVEGKRDPITGKRSYRYNLCDTGLPKMLPYNLVQPTLLPKRFRVTRSDSVETGPRKGALSRISSSLSKNWRTGM